MRIIMLISAVLFIFSCSTSTTSKTMPNPDAIMVGMTVLEVRKIMGPPENWQSKDNEEAWQYCKANRFRPMNDVILIWFYSGKVTGVNIYRSVGLGACDVFFRTIDWENAPSRVPNKKPE